MELKELLERTLTEINELRAERRFMGARLDMFDNIMSIFNADKPGQTMGMIHPNLVNELKKKINEVNTKEKAKILPTGDKLYEAVMDMQKQYDEKVRKEEKG